MQVETKDGQTIHVHESGEDSKNIVLIHGWMMAGAVFEPILGELGAFARVHVPDLRGAGASSAADSYRLEDYAQDVIAVLEKTGRSALVGHSMGGAIAQLVAIERPDLVDEIVLVNTVPASGMPLPEEAMALFSASPGDREKQSIILGMACLQLGDEERNRLLDIASTVTNEAIQQSLVAWTTGGFAERLGQIKAPAHVVATSDPFLPPEFLQSAVVDPIEGAKLHVLDGPGHYPASEAPQALLGLLREVLDTPS